MIPAIVDFQCWANADYTEEFALVVGGSPYDLTGSTLDMDVRSFARSSTSIFELHTVTTDIQGLRITDAVDGTLAIRINQATLETAYAAAASTVLSSDVLNFTYDLRITHFDGVQEILMQGVVVVNPGVTRS